MKSITIIGSGLAGTLLALFMARRGYEVYVFEARPDLRKTAADRGRSINLALSCRGITGLASLGLMPQVEKIMVPMRARAIHEATGIKFQPFGRRHDEHINAIQRSDLNKLLLDEAEKNQKIHLHFEMKLLHLDVDEKSIIFESKTGEHLTRSYERLIGADGAASVVREELTKKQLIQSNRLFLPHGYKELSISKDYPEDLVREHLHLWPRDAFMLLGNPNRDHSITGSLFMPMEGKNSFEVLDSNEETIEAFFKKSFADAYHAMPDLLGEFLENPIGHLSNIQCSPWYYKDQCLLIGDAAHGVVPFFGQGMNSAFEDCRILNEFLDKYQEDWQRVLPEFYQSRKINTDAVAKMSMDNYHEIQTDIRNAKFNLKKQLEQELMHRYPNSYVSKHVLVMFTNIPYAEALAYGTLQSELLNKISLSINHVEEVNWTETDKLMSWYDKKLANLQRKLKNL